MSQHIEYVLDHGFARLVSCMQPVDHLQLTDDPSVPATNSAWTGDLEIVRNARVSYDAAWRAGEDEGKDAKLINYLEKNHHTSPFEAMTFTFEVKAPIFVIRQWHRHRTWSYNEVSARYAQLPEEFYLPKYEHVGVQSSSNKQMRELEEQAGIQESDIAFINDLRDHSIAGFKLYQAYITLGKPRELARLFLGLNTYTHMFATVDLHNLIHFLRLRLHAHAQYEIQVYAEALLKLIEPVVPVAVDAFRQHRLA